MTLPFPLGSVLDPPLPAPPLLLLTFFIPHPTSIINTLLTIVFTLREQKI